MRRLLAPLLVISELVLSSCTSTQAACEKYVDSFNALECIAEEQELVKKDYCPDNLDDGCSVAKWYECLVGKHYCVELEDGTKVLNTEGYDGCAEHGTCE